MKTFSTSVKPICLAVALVLALPGCGDKSPDELIASGKQFQTQGNHKAAVLDFKTVVQAQPNNGEARLLLARSFIAVGDLQSADKELAKARELGAPADELMPLNARLFVSMKQHKRVIDEVRITPTLSKDSAVIVHSARALAYHILKQPDQAAAEIDSAEKIDANHPRLALTKANIALAKGDAQTAIAQADAAIQRDDKFIDAYYLKALALSQINRADESRAVSEQIIKLDPSQAQARMSIVSYFLNKNDLKGAEQALLAGEKASPGLVVTYYRALFDYRSGKIKEADAILLKVLSKIPDHLPSNLLHALTSGQLGNFERGLKSAAKVVEAEPENLFAAKVLAANQLLVGNAKAALETLLPRLEKHPQDPELLAAIADAYGRLRDYGNSMAYTDRAVAAAPRNPDYLRQRASGFMATGEQDRALAELENAAGLSSTSGQMDGILVTAYINRGEYDKALKVVDMLQKKQPNNPASHYLRGYALLAKGDEAGARPALEKALSLQPTNVGAARFLAQMDMKANNLKAAQGRFESILTKSPDNLQAMLGLANIAEKAKQDKEFVSWLEKAAKQHPKAIAPRAQLAYYYMQQKNPGRALAIAREAFANNSGEAEAFALLGATEYAAGEKENALVSYTRWVEKAPDSARALMRLGGVQAALGKTAAARDSFKRALQIDPTHDASQDALISLEMQEKRPQAALEVARMVQAARPKLARGYLLEGDILVNNNQAAQALKPLQKAFVLQPYSSTLIKLHAAQSITGDAKGADQRLQAWLKQHPQDEPALTYAAEYAMIGGRDAVAIAHYQALQRLRPNDALLLNNLAALYQKTRDRRALDLAQQAYRLQPADPNIQDTLGWLLVEQGQAKKGAELLAAASRNLPMDLSIRYHYAAALAQSGEKGKAKAELQAIVKTGRKFRDAEAVRTLLGAL